MHQDELREITRRTFFKQMGYGVDCRAIEHADGRLSLGNT